MSEGTLVAGPGTLLTTLTQTDPVKVRFGIADTDQMKWRSEVAAGQLQLPELPLRAQLPADVYSTRGRHRLALVTCGGPFLPASGHYRDNVVVIAVPV